LSLGGEEKKDTSLSSSSSFSTAREGSWEKAEEEGVDRAVLVVGVKGDVKGATGAGTALMARRAAHVASTVALSVN
jgi:hypothetical protein